ncbi:MAG: preprotein translocase subunit SecY [Candidatus Pacearchaeota archaeon]|nr:preprotein translocase subunit SecY [Candidatus Pacearchaeota archaeon]MDE1848632.1 preprotein translocase subunit SecY [Nanoarchaeota archaeon]
MDFRGILKFIPEIKSPEEKKLSFKEKAKWTIIVLLAFFVLTNIPLFGLSQNALSRFQYLAIILGTNFGSIISLGIGPIVMASVILQLLAGSGILNIDTTTAEGRKFFQGLQKIMVFFFIIFEAVVYVMMQGLQAAPGFAWLVILQLILGGLAIYYMDDLMTKWGLGSGVSLFIAAGVSWRLITSSLQFIDQQGRNCLLNFSTVPCSGKILVLIQSIITRQNVELLSAAAAIAVTIGIFLLVVWAQSLRVEIPLSFGRIRGYTVKQPLSFFYASVIPVILTAALVANVQLFGGIFENAATVCAAGGACSGLAQFASHLTFLGHFVQGQPVSGFAFWIGSTNILDLLIRGGFLPQYILQGFVHALFFMLFSTLFAVFWVKTSQMDAKSQAHKISASGLQVAGFRQDERVLETILDRYIMPLTVMGGLAIGLLAAITDLMGALVSGTSILLVIMITNQFYQNIAQQHPEVINPSLGKFVNK